MIKSKSPSCCTPSRGEARGKAPAAPPTLLEKSSVSTKVEIPGGIALLGTNSPQIAGDEEGPARTQKQKGFLIAPTTVTNEEFLVFVETTNYITEAERYGWSFVFHTDVPESVTATQGVVGTQWWRIVNGANWRNIHGPGTHILAWQLEHPVVQVSWNDAHAYAQWVGGRLSTEAKWEHAARGGNWDVRFPWGDNDPNDTDFLPCNIWQGSFPSNNTNADGWRSTAPAKSFEPNEYGLFNMVGNVWEWTADDFRKTNTQTRINTAQETKLLKGGSFLCHRSYCYRYRMLPGLGIPLIAQRHTRGFESSGIYSFL